MFTGIVETKCKVQKVQVGAQSLQISVEKPNNFDDLKIGDSIAINGVCLTVEAFDEFKMSFTLAAESLHITGWTEENFTEYATVNVERAMKASDRVHGHFVLGHVDGMAKVSQKKDLGEAVLYSIELPESFAAFVWRKGSITLNGVSLTINEVRGKEVEVCLIPETLKRTNLVELEVGESLTFEVDSMARAFVHLWKMEKENASI